MFSCQESVHVWRSVCLNKGSNKHGGRVAALPWWSWVCWSSAWSCLDLSWMWSPAVTGSGSSQPADSEAWKNKQTSHYRGGGRRADEAAQTLRLILRVGRSLLGGNPVKHDDSVGQVGRHDEVVLHHECCLLGVEDVPANKRRVTTAPHTGRDTRLQSTTRPSN